MCLLKAILIAADLRDLKYLHMIYATITKRFQLFIDSQSKQKFYQNKKLRSYNPVIIEWEILQPMGFDHRKWLKSKLVMLRRWLKVCWIQCLRTLAISQDWATTFTSETTIWVHSIRPVAKFCFLFRSIS